ncbi:Maf family protein [Salinisphaera sp. T31B1]|uniref:Maf family protein n=1 Tax=Salinisphaera sp. T31B1 TaxID=727963 RepID=UPI00333FBA70
MTRTRVILASASPQRTRLLDQLGVAHTAVPADIDETPRVDEPAPALAERLARTKAEALSAAYPQALIIGSDTVVAHGGSIFGKPGDAAEAGAMLTRLSAATHEVYSGVAVLSCGRLHSHIRRSSVTLRALTDADIAAYIASGEPFGKAGAYAIQGRGALFVQQLEGSYSAVMGLPLFELGELLAAVGFDPLAAS